MGRVKDAEDNRYRRGAEIAAYSLDSRRLPDLGLLMSQIQAIPMGKRTGYL
jgi:hypothetical protein